MSKTIVALYDHRFDAETATRDLQAEGIQPGNMEITSHSDYAATSGSSHGGGILSRLKGWSIPEQEAHVYAESVRRGGSILRIRADEGEVDRVLDILEQGNVVDLEQRGAGYRASGWSGYDESSSYYDENSAAEERARYATNTVDTDSRLSSAAETMRDVNAGHEEVIPIVEESLSVGKREVVRGRVRVHSYVVETPVQGQVALRDETVTVERRAVQGDRTLSDADFRERTIEVTESDEEATVAKAARVTEEVVVRKNVEERTQTVSDTVRRTEVEIDDGRTGAVDRDTDGSVRRDDDRRP